MTNVIGIDTGIHGAIALLRGEQSLVVDMPTMTVVVAGEERQRVDAGNLAMTLAGLCSSGTVAFVEQALAVQDMSVVAVFAFAEQFGMVRGVLAQLGVRTVLVQPRKWKAGFGLTVKGNRQLGQKGYKRNKAASIELARKLFPSLHRELNLAKHDGRAEALLIAHWGAEQLEAESAGPLFGHSVADVRKRATAEVEF